jgi:hypothetical protein
MAGKKLCSAMSNMWLPPLFMTWRSVVGADACTSMM